MKRVYLFCGGKNASDSDEKESACERINQSTENERPVVVNASIPYCIFSNWLPFFWLWFFLLSLQHWLKTLLDRLTTYGFKRATKWTNIHELAGNYIRFSEMSRALFAFRLRLWETEWKMRLASGKSISELSSWMWKSSCAFSILF